MLLSDPRLTATGWVVGTSGYVAPEVLRGAEPDPRQDLWSVGVVGLQLLSGRRPGDRATSRSVPPALDGWLRALAADDPRDRPPDAAAARAALSALGPLPAGRRAGRGLRPPGAAAGGLGTGRADGTRSGRRSRSGCDQPR